MDLKQETDVQKLKALCLDELDKIAIAQNNVQLLRERIAELQNNDAATPSAEPVESEVVTE